MSDLEHDPDPDFGYGSRASRQGSAGPRSGPYRPPAARPRLGPTLQEAFAWLDALPDEERGAFEAWNPVDGRDPLVLRASCYLRPRGMRGDRAGFTIARIKIAGRYASRRATREFEELFEHGVDFLSDDVEIKPYARLHGTGAFRSFMRDLGEILRARGYARLYVESVGNHALREVLVRYGFALLEGSEDSYVKAL